MELSVDKQEKATIMHLSGRLDAVTSPQFEQDLSELLAAPDNNLILDFAELDYVSSAGLRVVLKLAKTFKTVEWDFFICQVQDHVYEVFEMSGFEHFITIKQSIDDCIA